MMFKKSYGIALCAFLSLAASPSMASHSGEFTVDNQIPNTKSVTMMVRAFQREPYAISAPVLVKKIECQTGSNCTIKLSDGDVDTLRRFTGTAVGFTNISGFGISLSADAESGCSSFFGIKSSYSDVLEALLGKHFQIGPEKDQCSVLDH